MEILDNLPHDKIQAKSRKKVEQAIVRRPKNGIEEEVFVPLDDPLLSKVVKTVPSYATIYPSWVPSVACGVIDHVIQQRPNVGIVFADFDWLPTPDLDLESDERRMSAWAEGEPIITDMGGIDHECYLQAPPHCDILFPTDFDKLASFTKRISKSKSQLQVQVQKQSEFLQQYGPEQVQSTKSWISGHTPLLHDFSNCSVLTVAPKTVDSDKQ